MEDGINAPPCPTVNTTGYIDHAAFLGTITPDANKMTKHLFQGYLNNYNNYFKAPWMPDRTEANPNELNQDDARYGFRCCHLKNIWTAPLPPETELSRQMTTSTTSIDIMGLQAAYANLHFFFQAEDGIRDLTETGVQTCALPILFHSRRPGLSRVRHARGTDRDARVLGPVVSRRRAPHGAPGRQRAVLPDGDRLAPEGKGEPRGPTARRLAHDPAQPRDRQRLLRRRREPGRPRAPQPRRRRRHRGLGLVGSWRSGRRHRGRGAPLTRC